MEYLDLPKCHHTSNYKIIKQEIDRVSIILIKVDTNQCENKLFNKICKLYVQYPPCRHVFF